jgi:carbon-monoxide dehydrogenase medium subunit
MIPARFDYERAESVDHAIELLGSREGAKILAGGHSLLPMMKVRLARPATLVDIAPITELSYVRDAGDKLAVGALTRHHDIHHDPLIREHCEILSFAAGLVGDPQVRHRGTIGGSVSHGDPAADYPGIMAALEAEMVVKGPSGEWVLPAIDFFKGYYQCALGDQDVLTEVRVPKLEGATWSYLKYRRRAQDWAIVGVAAVKNGGTRVALTNMAPTPFRATAVEDALASGKGAEEAAALAAEGASPPSDTWGSANYRRHLATVLVRRALEEAGAGS